jgi:hypothetical protein
MIDDRFGQEESGIDGGGLFKEFLTSLSKEAFDTNRGLWLVTDENQLYPNPHSYAKEGKLCLLCVDEADDSPSIELVWIRKSQRWVVLMKARTSTWESAIRWDIGRRLFCEILPYVQFKYRTRLMSSGKMVREVLIPR